MRMMDEKKKITVEKRKAKIEAKGEDGGKENGMREKEARSPGKN
jgi:hypothetical protein